MDSLIALNITNDGKLLNPSKLPLLYYKTENSESILEDMCKDSNFYSFFKNNCLNVNDYHNIQVSYLVYNIKTEEYTDYTYKLQDIYSITSELSIQYIEQIFLDLYKRTSKEEYDATEDTLSIDIILDIYKMLKDKFGDRVSKETVKQYVRSQLQTKLNSKNLEKVIEIYTDIIE